MVASGIHFGQSPSHSTIFETIKLFNDIGVNHGFI